MRERRNSSRSSNVLRHSQSNIMLPSVVPKCILRPALSVITVCFLCIPAHFAPTSIVTILIYPNVWSFCRKKFSSMATWWKLAVPPLSMLSLGESSVPAGSLRMVYSTSLKRAVLYRYLKLSNVRWRVVSSKCGCYLWGSTVWIVNYSLSE